jgi:molecular chaperone DnaJ
MSDPTNRPDEVETGTPRPRPGGDGEGSNAILSDPDEQRRFDRCWNEGLEGDAPPGGVRRTDDTISGPGRPFGKLFEDRRPEPRPGADLVLGLEIDLLEAARGTARIIDCNRQDFCSECRGSGSLKSTRAATCNHCDGRGQVVQMKDSEIATICPVCEGKGVCITDPCPECRGVGRVLSPIRLEVPVPPGVESGMWLQQRNQGDVGDFGAPRGNLKIQIRVREHPIFQRRGNDVLCEVPITHGQASLGGEVEVPTLDGPHCLAIPRGTRSGQVLRIKRRGMPDIGGRGRGDELVTLLVEVADIGQGSLGPRRKGFFEKLRGYFTREAEPYGPGER